MGAACKKIWPLIRAGGLALVSCQDCQSLSSKLVNNCKCCNIFLEKQCWKREREKNTKCKIHFLSTLLLRSALSTWLGVHSKAKTVRIGKEVWAKPKHNWCLKPYLDLGARAGKTMFPIDIIPASIAIVIGSNAITFVIISIAFEEN